MNNKPAFKKTRLALILALSVCATNAISANEQQELRYAKPEGAVVEGHKIEVQLQDPLATDQNRLKDSRDLLRRALENQTKQLNISDETKLITEGLATSGPESLANLSIEIVNQSLMNDKSVDDLDRINDYYNATSKVIESMTTLVEKGRDLQLARDSLNESLTSGTMLKQLQDRINEQDEVIKNQQMAINQLNAELKQTFEFMGTLKNAIQETNSAFKNTMQQVRTEQSLAIQRAAENASAAQAAPVDNGVPYTVISTLVITDEDNKVTRSSVRIRYKQNGLELEADKGFSVGGWKIESIDAGGIDVKHTSGESMHLLAEG